MYQTSFYLDLYFQEGLVLAAQNAGALLTLVTGAWADRLNGKWMVKIVCFTGRNRLFSDLRSTRSVLHREHFPAFARSGVILVRSSGSNRYRCERCLSNACRQFVNHEVC